MRFLRSNRCESINRSCELIGQAREIDLAFKSPTNDIEAYKLIELLEVLLRNGGRGRVLLEHTHYIPLLEDWKELQEKYRDRLEINLLKEKCDLNYSVLLADNHNETHTIIGLDHHKKLGTLCKDSISIELPLSNDDKAYIKNHLNELNRFSSPII